MLQFLRLNKVNKRNNNPKSSSVKMEFFRNSLESARYQWINRAETYKLFDKENEHRSRKSAMLHDRSRDKSQIIDYTAGRYKKFGENHQVTVNTTRNPEDCHNDYLSDSNKKQRLLNESYKRSNSRKRARQDDEYDLRFELHTKKQRLDAPVIQYAIKKPNQSANAMRKILEKLFDPDITADGWEKSNDGFQYHTKIRGRYFYQLSNTIDKAKELVAEMALKELCNFKYESILWPEKLLKFRLNQDFADEIENLVKDKFDKIMVNDREFKGHKVRSGIVMTTNGNMSDAKVIAIGTGTKCIPNIMDDDSGTILHDMHAEVLARRSFVRFLYDQLNAMLSKKSTIFRTDGEEIHLKENLKFHLYINTIPCGDARVFSLKGIVSVKNEASPGSLRTKKIGGTKVISSENGFRVNSLSCSDKIARWNVLGLQGILLAKFIKPIYLDSVILGSSYVPIHMYRSMIGRLENAVIDLPKDYFLNKPKFESTSLVETENLTSAEDFGVCWSYGDGYAPEILNLHTGLTISGQKSNVSKLSFMNMYQSINQKLANRSDEGIEKFKTAKKTFYAALKKENFGDWNKSLEP